MEWTAHLYTLGAITGKQLAPKLLLLENYHQVGVEKKRNEERKKKENKPGKKKKMGRRRGCQGQEI